ncbi:MAG: hypothetical protein KDJ74_16070 [Notoacmeibacter sp.]|nr:hypothetical protein [Notoacmeibacter sp.]
MTVIDFAHYRKTGEQILYIHKELAPEPANDNRPQVIPGAYSTTGRKLAYSQDGKLIEIDSAV